MSANPSSPSDQPNRPDPSNPVPAVEQAALDALAQRLAATRLPRLTSGSSAAPGPSMELAERLLTHWRDEFDWRAIEARAEALGATLATTADGRRLATLHVRATPSTGLPILLVHGWPDSPLRFVELIPRLVAAGHDVVAPAIPGTWYSDEPQGEMSRELAADDLHQLMVGLGYSRYAVHGGDWGSAVAQSIAQRHADAVAAVHLTDVPFDLAFTIDAATASDAEAAYLQRTETFADGAFYLTGNSTQPNLVATALQDSPIGLVMWIGALYEAWSDNPIAVEHIVTNAALLYLTGTVRSSMRLYSEPASAWDAEAWGGDGDAAGAGDATDAAGWQADAADAAWGGASDATGDAAEGAGTAADWGAGDAGEGWDAASWVVRVEAPTAFALFPRDLVTAPRELAERHFAVERFTVMPRGGHFAALEQPEALATDIIEFLAERA